VDYLQNLFGYTMYVADLSYPNIFLALLASGHVIPIPEGITLILLGYGAALGKGDVFGFIVVGIIAVAFFDILLFSISLGGSHLARRLIKKVDVHLLERYRGASGRRVCTMVILSHFVPGWRFANPIIAGIAKIEWKRFTLYTLVSACLYAPLYIGFGFFFRSRIFDLLYVLRSAHEFLVPLLLSLVLVIFLTLVFENRKSVYNKGYAKK
jgi:membrane protein DedA with SNARE-associated domain